MLSSPTEGSLDYLTFVIFFFFDFVYPNAEMKALVRPQTVHEGLRKNFTGMHTVLGWLILKPEHMLKVRSRLHQIPYF